MISLVYVSSAVHLMSNEELLEVLHISQTNNEKYSVTGMLLYMGGNFMQVLEGPEEGVTAIFEKIKNDKRHFNITVISMEPIVERQFEKWTMAFRNLDEEVAKKESAFSEFLNDEFTADKYREMPERAYRLLLRFREDMR
mgnify:CR=1 FL=1